MKKQGKGNKPSASVALTSEEFKLLYDKGLLGMCSFVPKLYGTQKTLDVVNNSRV